MGQGRTNVNTFGFKIYGVVALSALLVGTLGLSCNDLLSVPQLRHADNDEIVNIGDSIFALSGDIYTELRLKAHETWRHYALTGSQMSGGFLGMPIPDQYQMARDDDPNIRVVYMNGGANEVLIQAVLGDPYRCKQCNYWFCGDISRRCRALIDNTYVVGENLLYGMEDDGVEQVVFLGYYHPTLGLFGDMRQLIKATDYSAGLIIDGIEAAQASGSNAVYVDPRDAFDGMEWLYVTVDGLHPTALGSRVLANMIWDVIDYP